MAGLGLLWYLPSRFVGGINTRASGGSVSSARADANWRCKVTGGGGVEIHYMEEQLL